MKDGRTHLAYKAENVVDLETDLVLGAEVYEADNPDTNTLVDNLMGAQAHLTQAGTVKSIDEVAAEKGYHAAQTLALADALNLRTYIPQPERKALQAVGGLTLRLHFALFATLNDRWSITNNGVLNDRMNLNQPQLAATA